MIRKDSLSPGVMPLLLDLLVVQLQYPKQIMCSPITPSTDTANAGEFSITFSVTDGSTGVVSAVSDFTLAFGVDISLSDIR